MKSIRLIALTTVYFLTNIALQACSSCTTQYTQKKLDAYLGTTILLSLMPFILAAIFGVVYYRKFRAKQNS
jgi:uncharacterized transporter YbjL